MGGRPAQRRGTRAARPHRVGDSFRAHHRVIWVGQAAHAPPLWLNCLPNPSTPLYPLHLPAPFRAFPAPAPPDPPPPTPPTPPGPPGDTLPASSRPLPAGQPTQPPCPALRFVGLCPTACRTPQLLRAVRRGLSAAGYAGKAPGPEQNLLLIPKQRLAAILEVRCEGVRAAQWRTCQLARACLPLTVCVHVCCRSFSKAPRVCRQHVLVYLAHCCSFGRITGRISSQLFPWSAGVGIHGGTHTCTCTCTCAAGCCPAHCCHGGAAGLRGGHGRQPGAARGAREPAAAASRRRRSPGKGPPQPFVAVAVTVAVAAGQPGRKRAGGGG